MISNSSNFIIKLMLSCSYGENWGGRGMKWLILVTCKEKVEEF